MTGCRFYVGGLRCLEESPEAWKRPLLIGTGCDCIPEAVSRYNADVVVALYESWECDVEIPDSVYHYHVPVRDFSVEPLDHVLEAVAIIARELCRGRTVVVSCRGGCGRTGTVIALFNIVFNCVDVRGALEEYYEKRGCGPEAVDQETLLYVAERISAGYGCSRLCCRRGEVERGLHVLEAIRSYAREAGLV